MKQEAHPTMIKAVVLLGYASVLSFGLSVAIGFLFDSIGMNSLFFQMAIPICLITLVLGMSLLRQSMKPEDQIKVRLATRLAFVSLVTILLIVVFIAIFFTWIFRQA